MMHSFTLVCSLLISFCWNKQKETVSFSSQLQLCLTVSFLFLQLAASGISDEERKASMNSVNPKYVLRNYLCQSAIDAAEQGDFGVVRRILKIMERPYDEQPGMEKYARLPPAWAYRPGVCMLSCSSWTARYNYTNTKNKKKGKKECRLLYITVKSKVFSHVINRSCIHSTVFFIQWMHLV